MPKISKYTESLIAQLRTIFDKKQQVEGEFIEVSKTVSFFALMYEKVRNVIEFKDEHIIRRNAINRIVRRRLAFNPTLKDEALSIAKEIAWAGYFTTNKIPESKIDRLEQIIDWYIALRNELIKGIASEQKRRIIEFVYDLFICQVEELFAEKDFAIDKLFTFYMYQVLNPQISITGMSEEDKNLYFYIATEKTLLKSDTTYLRYHLFRLLFEHLLLIPKSEFPSKHREFRRSFAYIDQKINYNLSKKIRSYLRNQRPAFLILKEFFLENNDNLESIIQDTAKLQSIIESICREKYETVKEKLRRAGIRSILYIFFTKMVFVLIAEYPLLVRLNEKIDPLILGINALFPVVLMGLFVGAVAVPDDENTQRIYQKVRMFLYGDNQEQITFREKPKKEKNIFKKILFWLFYIITFGLTFWLIDYGLRLLHFTWLSKIIFFFFVTAVSFFGYRVQQIAKEYIVAEKESIFTPVIDFFMVPLISVGKWLSSEISKINILIFIFDFLIEAPFKILFDVIEEWISFLKSRKEEMT